MSILGESLFLRDAHLPCCRVVNLDRRDDVEARNICAVLRTRAAVHIANQLHFVEVAGISGAAQKRWRS